MATWTSPPTWIATDTPDFNDLNDLSENLRFLHTKDKVHAYLSANQAVTDSTWEEIDWDAEDYDSNAMHSNVSNHSRLVAPTDGAYFVEFKVNWAVETAGMRRVMLRKNANAVDSGGTHLGTWYQDGIATYQTTVAGGRLVVLSATDYVEAFAYQTSGGGLDIESGANTSFMQMMQITG